MKSSASISRETEDADKEGLCPNKHVRLLSMQGKCYNCGGLGHRSNDCSQPKRTQQKETTEKRDFQKPKIAQASEVADESARESVSKIVAATVP